ncbi:DUF2777 family protein [Halalkalibacter oceani]|uniref:DUF2777 family protein n=1 Tax=Halalkalibacter oceani TaxID=1653776 RepID=UPI003394EF3E
MDRKQAQNHIGKAVIIDEGQGGSYLGMLEGVIAPPRKTWRGTVQIQAVVELPSFLPEKDEITLLPLKYKDRDVVECIGSKLSLAPEEISTSFQQSMENAAIRRLQELMEQKESLAHKQKALEQFVDAHDLSLPEEAQMEETEDEEDEAIAYTFHYENGKYLLLDERKEALALEECPFELQWVNENNETCTGHYEENGTFMSNDGVRFSPKEGTVFTIDKKQFDPYVIFQKELEPGALQSLEKSLQSFGVSHDHLVDCHNALLTQFLLSEGRTSFQGVNFLTYRGSQGIIMVQHHFDRKLHNQKNDEIYDRFEFTTEQGKRSIVTYTNEFSR